METLTLSISGMTCGHCVASVRRALEAVPGVEIDDVRIGSADLRLSGTEAAAATAAALAAVQDAGYDATVDTAPQIGAAPRATTGTTCCSPPAAELTPLASRRST